MSFRMDVHDSFHNKKYSYYMGLQYFIGSRVRAKKTFDDLSY